MSTDIISRLVLHPGQLAVSITSQAAEEHARRLGVVNKAAIGRISTAAGMLEAGEVTLARMGTDGIAMAVFTASRSASEGWIGATQAVRSALVGTLGGVAAGEEAPRLLIAALAAAFSGHLVREAA